MCADIEVHSQGDGLILIETPFYFADGDTYQIYLKLTAGGWRLTDMGHTFMHLSYDSDLSKLREGTRLKILNQILGESSVEEDNGELFIHSAVESLSQDIFTLGQTLTRIMDLSFLNRVRVESTFYEDLEDQLYSIVPQDSVAKDFFANFDPNHQYPIDYRILGNTSPVYVFGVASKDKAKLATIVLERLTRHEENFSSLIVFADQESIPRPDLARLTNAGGEMVASLSARSDLVRKVERMIR